MSKVPELPCRLSCQLQNKCVLGKLGEVTRVLDQKKVQYGVSGGGGSCQGVPANCDMWRTIYSKSAR